MALAFARDHDRPAWLVLDAFFPTAKVFRLARSVYSVALKQPYLHVSGANCYPGCDWQLV
jgi:hypothetical protein